MAQETTEKPIRSSRTSLTIGPASMTCFSTWVSKTPAVRGITGKNQFHGNDQGSLLRSICVNALYNGFDAPFQSS